MKKTVATALIVTGTLFLLVAGGLFVHSRAEDHLAGVRAQNLLQQVLGDQWEQPELPTQGQLSITSVYSATALVPGDDELGIEGADEDPQDSEDAVEDEGATVAGTGGASNNTVIGILEIPGLDLRLPVLNRSTYALLDVSVCRYTGSFDGKPERLVIAGHNYRSHFGRISSLRLGNRVSFTTRDGETFRYSVIGIESCHMNDRAALQAGEEWDITLLTCQRDRTMRTLVRLKQLTIDN